MREVMAPSMPARVQKLDAALNESRVDVVLGSRVALLELLLRRQAPGAERWIHQHHIETCAHEIDKRDALRGVARKKPSAHARAAGGGFRKAPQRLDDARLGFVEELRVVDARQIELALASQRLHFRQEACRLPAA